jgi:hypothetical protein
MCVRATQYCSNSLQRVVVVLVHAIWYSEHIWGHTNVLNRLVFLCPAAHVCCLHILCCHPLLSDINPGQGMLNVAVKLYSGQDCPEDTYGG